MIVNLIGGLLIDVNFMYMYNVHAHDVSVGEDHKQA